MWLWALLGGGRRNAERLKHSIPVAIETNLRPFYDVWPDKPCALPSLEETALYLHRIRYVSGLCKLEHPRNVGLPGRLLCEELKGKHHGADERGVVLRLIHRLGVLPKLSRE